MESSRTVAVFGAYGHTGRFVVSELVERGLSPILAGRDADKLRAMGLARPGLDVRPASVDDPASLDRALAGAVAVINCAGPFAKTAGPVIEAALRARIHYLDVAAEIEANIDTIAQYTTRALEAGIVVVPAMAFYGGLGDLLATAAMGDWTAADEITIAYGLSSWKPTVGTRIAGQVSRERREGRRIVFSQGRMELRTDSAPLSEWAFPPPLGRQQVVGEFTMADTVTISHHVKTPEIRSFMTLAAVKGLSDPDLSPPSAVDESGRSSQTFVVEIVVHWAGGKRRAYATGQDIYAVTGPLVVEATQRVLDGRIHKTGLVTAGEAFDAHDFLRSLGRCLSFEVR